MADQADPRTQQFHQSICQYLSSIIPETQFGPLCTALGVSAEDAKTGGVDLQALFKQHAPQPPQPFVPDAAAEAKFQAYKELITSRGYFQQFPEGSAEYNERLSKARERFFAKFNATPQVSTPTATPPSTKTGLTPQQREEKGNEHKLKANQLLVERKWEEAIKEYSEAISYTENAIFYANRAVPLGKLGRFKEAVEDCKKSIAVDKTYTKAYTRLASNYQSLRDFTAAVQALQDGLLIEPHNAQLKADLAKAEAELQASKNPQGANPYQQMMSGLGGMDGAQGAGMPAGMPGMPGGMPGMPGGMPQGFMEMMSDPRFMAMAQNMVMSNPQLRQMAEQVAQNPDMLNQMMQGQMPGGLGEQLAAAFGGEEGMQGLANMFGQFGMNPGQGPPPAGGAGGMGGM